MQSFRHPLVGLVIVAGALFPFTSSNAGGLGSAIGAGIGDAMEKYGEIMQQEAREKERFEQQKRLMEYQMKLEDERLQRQREYDEKRREEALRLQKEEDARRQELARKKAEEERRLAISTGTGFFVAPNGYLVTNNHVIDDTTDYAVRDFKGRFYRTQLVARDPKRDLALLKVSGNFPSLRIAHSDTVSKGQRVFAVGYPQIAIQGNESKVTDGIISSFSGIRNDDDWFQISAPIQGGNSGGPLVTESGNVVGVVVASVNVAKFYAKAGTLPQNVNYAIKSKLVLDFLKAQGVKNTPTVPAKAGLETVDSATAMVIAKNGPIDVAYAVSPEQSAADERARLRQAAGEATEKKRLAAILNRDKAVKTTFPDWEEVRQSDMFLAWLNEQTDNSSKMLESLNAADVMRVIRRYKAGQSKFAEKLLEREEAEHWRRADGATDSATVQAYLDRFPAGRHAAEARVKLAALTKEQAEMRPGKVFKDCADCPEMVILPTGSFEMGSPASEAGFHYSESPQHRVSLRSFAAGKHEITRGQFAAFVRDSGHSAHECEGGSGKKLSGSNWQKTPYSQADSHPVVCVNWDDARAYVTWLSRKTGKSYRLLSEAEWEYAARAGTSTARYWGESPDQACGYANVSDQTAKSQLSGWSQEVHNCTDGHAFTAPVGSFKPNTFGLYDMIGNVFEWTEDCWNESYSSASGDGSAWTSGDCGRRVIRGSSFGHDPRLSRSAFRGRADSSARFILTGFRAARMLP